MSSLFFEYKCTVGRSELDKVFAWSYSAEDPILAVATRGFATAKVVFFREEGQQMLEHSIKRPGDANVLTWHPKRRILACGWSDGVVSLWYMKEQITREDNVIHKNAALQLLNWNEDGSRLISGDTEGTIGVWQSDNRGRLIHIIKYERGGGLLTSSLFIDLTNGASSPDSSNFLVGSKSGGIAICDDSGGCQGVYSTVDSSSVSFILPCEKPGEIMVVTESLQLLHLRVSGTRGQYRVQEIRQVRLGVKPKPGCEVQAEWVGPGLLMIGTGELNLRFLDIFKNENYVLPVRTAFNDPDSGMPAVSEQDVIVSVDFNRERSTLAVATHEGHLMMWKFSGAMSGKSADVDGDGVSDLWEPIFHKHFEECELYRLQWGTRKELMSVAMDNDGRGELVILNETELHSRVSETMSVFQFSPTEFYVEHKGWGSGAINSSEDPGSKKIKCQSTIRGAAVFNKLLVAWGNNSAELFDFGAEDGQESGAKLPNTQGPLCFQHDHLYAVNGDHVDVAKLGGKKVDSLPFTEIEGKPFVIDINSHFIVVATTQGIIKIYTAEDPKTVRQMGSRTRFVDFKTNKSLGKIRDVKINCDGTRVAILSDTESTDSYSQQPNTKLHVYNADTHGITAHDFGPARFPAKVCWDCDEPKLVCVQTSKVHGYRPPSKNDKNGGAGKDSGDDALLSVEDESVVDDDDRSTLATLFATDSHGVLLQDSFSFNSDKLALVSMCVPYIYFAQSSQSADGVVRLKSRMMKDFVGLDTVDEKTRSALIEFSYFLTIGNMDLAYSAVKAIESPEVWENMLQVCVKTKRLDVAEVCLGNMKNARGAKMVRETKLAEPGNLDVAIAMVAIQLGLLTEAEKLYKNAKRFDLLNKLYQASGQWEKAIEVANRKDRIHLRTTHYKYARHLESLGQYSKAIRQYELSKTHTDEVPRMMYNANKTNELEEYIQETQEIKLLRWWGQYLESDQDIKAAFEFYQHAGDSMAMMRIRCFSQEWKKAEKLVKNADPDGMQRPLAYHLAREYEGAGEEKVKEAIDMYVKAGRYNHAIRLAIANEFDIDIMQLAMQCPDPPVVKIAARYFEQRGDMDKAISLYRQGKATDHALHLCFAHSKFGQLAEIAMTMDENTDPAVFRRCADFFIDNQQYDKAVELAISSKNYDDAMELALEHKVILTESMVEGMTMEKKKGSTVDDKELNAARKELLLKIASTCKKQNSFHLAAKKYTQAGEKLKAMKSLLMSGDTERIIFFANVARLKEVYILAANYLSNLENVHEQDDTVKAIINCYYKARAFRQLGSFFDSMAMTMMDELSDYKRSLKYLKNAVKFLKKEKAKKDVEGQMKALTARIEVVEEFTKIQALAEEKKVDEVEVACEKLLKHPNVEAAVRVGDVFALLVKTHMASNKAEAAMRAVHSMETRWRLDVTLYIERSLLNEVYKANGRDELKDRDEAKDAAGGGEGKSGDVGDDAEGEGVGEEEIGSDVGSEIGSEIGSDVEDEFSD